MKLDLQIPLFMPILSFGEFNLGDYKKEAGLSPLHEYSEHRVLLYIKLSTSLQLFADYILNKP